MSQARGTSGPISGHRDGKSYAIMFVDDGKDGDVEMRVTIQERRTINVDRASAHNFIDNRQDRQIEQILNELLG